MSLQHISVTLREGVKSSTNIKFHRYQIPNVAKSSSAEYALALVSPEGRLHSVRLNSASTNLAISLRQKPEITVPSIDEVYAVSGIDRDFQDDNLGYYFSNAEGVTADDDKEFIYIKLDNSDTVNDTGTIDFELIFEEL